MTNGWHVGKFGDVLEPVSRPVQVEADKVYRNLGVQWYAYGLFVREEKPGHEIRAKELYRVELGDLVYNRLFAWKGSFAIADKDTAGGFVSGEFPCFRVDTNLADAKYLHLYLSQEKIWEEIERTSTGQTSISRLRLKEPIFLDMDIPLPPLDEQRRIVEHVESISARIAKAQSLREEADKEAKIFIASLSNQVLNRLNTEEVSLGSVVIRARNGFGRRPKTEEKGPIVLRLADVSMGKISLANPRRIEMTEDEFREFEVRKGDIIFVRVNGSLPIVGRCIPCDIDFQEKVTYNDHLIRARVDATKVYSRYATLWLNSPDMRKLIQSKAITTAGQYSISQTSILSLPIKLPPLDEQRRIVAYLDSVQARLASLRELQSATGEELSALLPSVLDRAFSGRL